ncbi:hypothetical protein CHUAL_013635 [Chamberlinius hualienensis]
MNTTLKKVLITDPIDKSCIEILESNNIAVNYKPKLPFAEILNEIKDADALIIRSGTNVNAQMIEAAKQLKIIGRAGVGVDNVDCNAATRNGVVVINAPCGNTLSAAEHTCAMIMALARKIPQACETLKNERWDRNKFMGHELYGKTLAIVGLGRIGREVAHRMQSFGMKTIGFDPLVSNEESATFDVEWLQLDDIWPRADYVTLHVPLIPQTKNMINKAVLSKCKKGIRFVNVARGGIIDDADILEALDSGDCGGLAVDVFVEEPPKEFGLIKHPNVICTPHLGANTVEAQIKVAQEISTQFLDFVGGRPLSGAVNAGALNDSMSEEGRTWARIAKALGQLAVNITSAGSKDEFGVTVVLGENLAKYKNLLLASTLSGILEKTGGKINLINTSLLASAAGIQAKVEIKNLNSDVSTVGVDIVKNDEHHFVVGTAVGHLPLLLSIDSANFGDGIPLKGVSVFFKSNPNAKCLGSIIDNLSSQSTTVNFASESTCLNGDKWYVIGLSKKLQSTKDVGSEISTFVAQVEF